MPQQYDRFRAQLLAGMRAQEQREGFEEREDLQEESAEDRQIALGERIRHDRHMEQIEDIHAYIAEQQEAAKLAADGLKQHMADMQAQDVKDAAAKIAALDPKSADYGRNLAVITAEHPYAFTKSANGLEEPIIKATAALDQQNKTWQAGQADFWKKNQELFNNYAEKGITPATRPDGSVDVAASNELFQTKMKDAATAAKAEGLQPRPKPKRQPGAT
jgi:hypothetical protein